MQQFEVDFREGGVFRCGHRTLKYTHRVDIRVDINLDGLVTPDDSAIFGTNYSENIFANWAMGDLDYDGLFTPTDAAIFGTFYDESLPQI